MAIKYCKNESINKAVNKADNRSYWTAAIVGGFAGIVVGVAAYGIGVLAHKNGTLQMYASVYDSYTTPKGASKEGT